MEIEIPVLTPALKVLVCPITNGWLVKVTPAPSKKDPLAARGHQLMYAASLEEVNEIVATAVLSLQQ